MHLLNSLAKIDSVPSLNSTLWKVIDHREGFNSSKLSFPLYQNIIKAKQIAVFVKMGGISLRQVIVHGFRKHSSHLQKITSFLHLKQRTVFKIMQHLMYVKNTRRSYSYAFAFAKMQHIKLSYVHIHM